VHSLLLRIKIQNKQESKPDFRLNLYISKYDRLFLGNSYSYANFWVLILTALAALVKVVRGD